MSARPVYSADDALAAMRTALGELAAAEVAYDKAQARYQRRTGLPADVAEIANRDSHAVLKAGRAWTREHTRVQSYALAAAALLLAEFLRPDERRPR